MFAALFALAALTLLFNDLTRYPPYLYINRGRAVVPHETHYFPEWQLTFLTDMP
jgi:hypothetical protein